MGPAAREGQRMTAAGGPEVAMSARCPARSVQGEVGVARLPQAAVASRKRMVHTVTHPS
jgi:hypothetical protein